MRAIDVKLGNLASYLELSENLAIRSCFVRKRRSFWKLDREVAEG
jgi:hypothetical protein